jgi:hypothetical protein
MDTEKAKELIAKIEETQDLIDEKHLYFEYLKYTNFETLYFESEMETFHTKNECDEGTRIAIELNKIQLEEIIENELEKLNELMKKNKEELDKCILNS